MRVSQQRIMALNSFAIRLPNAVLSSKIRLPIGRQKSIQAIDPALFYDAGWAMQVGLGPARIRFRDPRRFATFHLRPCREILNGA